MDNIVLRIIQFVVTIVALSIAAYLTIKFFRQDPRQIQKINPLAIILPIVTVIVNIVLNAMIK
jgi:hypothetical protein